MVNLMRVKRVVCEGVPSLSWSEQFEGPFFWSDQDSVSLQADAAIALCDDDALAYDNMEQVLDFMGFGIAKLRRTE